MVRKAFEEGRSEAVDLLVNDIYGQNCDTIGLPGKIIASSLGKLAKSNESHFEVSDVARALTIALAINIANILGLLLTSQESQTAVLVSNELHNDYFYSLLQVNFP